jgi:hypothetical protein
MPRIGIILGSTRPNRNGEQNRPFTEFENLSGFKPGDYNVGALHTLLDEVIAWSAALASLRQTAAVA